MLQTRDYKQTPARILLLPVVVTSDETVKHITDDNGDSDANGQLQTSGEQDFGPGRQVHGDALPLRAVSR